MEFDLTQMIGLLSLAALFVGGWVKQRMDVQAKFAELQAEQSKQFAELHAAMNGIKQQLELEEKYRDERNDAAMVRIRSLMYDFCKSDCPQKRELTNMRIHLDALRNKLDVLRDKAVTAPGGVPVYKGEASE